MPHAMQIFLVKILSQNFFGQNSLRSFAKCVNNSDIRWQNSSTTAISDVLQLGKDRNCVIYSSFEVFVGFILISLFTLNTHENWNLKTKKIFSFEEPHLGQNVSVIQNCSNIPRKRLQAAVKYLEKVYIWSSSFSSAL